MRIKRMLVWKPVFPDSILVMSIDHHDEALPQKRRGNSGSLHGSMKWSRLKKIVIVIEKKLNSPTILAKEENIFIFDFHSNVLFWVLLLPYLTFLTLVPLTTTYLTNNFSFAKAFKLTSIIISVGIFTFSILSI